MIRTAKNENSDTRLTFGRTLAISWLPVAESARSTIMALRALYRLVRYEANEQRNGTRLFAGSHMRLMILSKVSFPPSFNAFVMDLIPCSFVAYSRRPPRIWSSARSRWRCEPCSRTEGDVNVRGDVGATINRRTVLNAV